MCRVRSREALNINDRNVVRSVSRVAVKLKWSLLRKGTSGVRQGREQYNKPPSLRETENTEGGAEKLKLRSRRFPLDRLVSRVQSKHLL
ncbi:MAG: hypothetical protein QOD33_1200 [Pyrinomonadaceae bacterium]|nr:hypothetical protein [Pyrinomonadaceae bacterium]